MGLMGLTGAVHPTSFSPIGLQSHLVVAVAATFLASRIIIVVVININIISISITLFLFLIIIIARTVSIVIADVESLLVDVLEPALEQRWQRGPDAGNKCLQASQLSTGQGEVQGVEKKLDMQGRDLNSTRQMRNGSRV